MKIIILAESRKFEKYGRFLQTGLCHDAECSMIFLPEREKSREGLIKVIKQKAPDILLTVDLLGFEQCTLTDNIAYNLLDCKQIHLLLHEGLENEKFLNKQLSIAMFFYVQNTAYYEHLMTNYAGLPYLGKISNWQTGDSESEWRVNAEILIGIIKEVMEACHLH